MAATTSSYSITMRLHTAPDHGIVGAVATAIAQAGAIVTALDVVDSDPTHACSSTSPATPPTPATPTRSSSSWRRRRRRRRSARSPTARSCCTSAERSRSAPRWRCATATSCPGRTRRASPGSAWRSRRIPPTRAGSPIKRNTVAVVSDGSAVLGLGNIGPGRGDAGDGGQGRPLQALRRGGRLAGRAWTHRTPTRSWRSSRRSRRRTAASTWRTSPRRGASRSRCGCASCSTSRSSTTISTAPRSACWPR